MSSEQQTVTAAQEVPLAFVLKRDGNQWCATRPDFVNLQESPAGFGDTENQALDELLVAHRRLCGAAFEIARGAEKRRELLLYDCRGYEHRMDVWAEAKAQAIKDYNVADAEADRLADIVDELTAAIKQRHGEAAEMARTS